ncbi:MAG TPA: S8 family serine peptidase [Solirubrobacterales bacterium]|jgi:serine protease
MTRRALILSAVFGLLSCTAVVAPADAATGLSPAHGFAPHQVIVKFDGEARGRALPLPPGVGVREAATALRGNPRVAYAEPNYIATASEAPFLGIPNDPGVLDAIPSSTAGGWVSKQWNFLPWEGEGNDETPTSSGGIDAVGAWRRLAEAGRPGAQGVKVAVLDTGIAYRSKGKRFRRSPDFTAGQFVKGYDFVANDRLPMDENGHGTHVAGTIGEKTNNGIALTGLAYRAGLMPVRVLDRYGSGQADDIARGIRYAVDHGADVINMSFNFGCHKRVPVINEELRRANRMGVVTVASIGNLGAESCVAPPATGPGVIGVGGTTEGGCLGAYSLSGKGVDVVAPGGGTPAPGCPSVLTGPIYQVTLKGGNPSVFAEPADYVGTSMAAAHVSGVAAMILASGVLPPKLKGAKLVGAVTARLEGTARSIGLPRTEQGAGLIDAARATDPSD